MTENTPTPAINRWDANRTERVKAENAAKVKEHKLLDREFGPIIDMIENELVPLNEDGSPNLEQTNFPKAQAFLEHCKKFKFDDSQGNAPAADAPKEAVKSDKDADAPKGHRQAWKRIASGLNR